jgi:hypothetical protein
VKSLSSRSDSQAIELNEEEYLRTKPLPLGQREEPVLIVRKYEQGDTSTGEVAERRNKACVVELLKVL